MEQKKVTKAQLERRIQNAIVFVPKDKKTKSIFFSDKGLRVTVTFDTAVVQTNYHSHVFTNITTSGISRPFLYMQKLVEIALANDCETEDGYSFAKLLKVLKVKEEKFEYNICVYIDWWLFNIFQPLYTIGEGETESFIVYYSYLNNIAVQSILLSEKTDDLTNVEFIKRVSDAIKEFTANIEERVIIKKKTDEEIVEENVKAMEEIDQEMIMGDEKNGI